MGRMPGRVLLAGGPDVEKDGMEEVTLWAPVEEEGTEISEEESAEEDGPSPPLQM